MTLSGTVARNAQVLVGAVFSILLSLSLWEIIKLQVDLLPLGWRLLIYGIMFLVCAILEIRFGGWLQSYH